LTTQAWLNTTNSQGTYTVSVASVVATSAIAIQVGVRLQDNNDASFVRAYPKASVATNPAAQVKITADTASQVVIHQGMIPINTTRTFLYQINDGGGTAVQTASVGIVGYWY
jgi:TPP-dependent 2-oxoacid decarboxylase